MKGALEAVGRIRHRVGLVIHSDGMARLWRWCNRPRVLLGALLVLMVVWNLIGRGENELFNWSRYHVTNDSRGYVRPFQLKSLTPPVYHWFVQAASVTGYEGTPPLGTTDLAESSVLERLAEPLYRVVFVQRLIFLGAIFTFLYAVMRLTAPWVGFVLALALVWGRLVTTYSNHVLTECLTQSFVMLGCAGFLCFLRTKKINWIVPVSVVSALAYLTRPAAVYMLPLVGIMGIMSLRPRWKRDLVPLAVGALLLLSAFALEFIRIPQESEKVNLNPTFLYHLVNFEYAVQIAEPEDADLIGNDTSRAILLDGIRLRKETGIRDVGSAFFQKIHVPITVAAGLDRYSKKAMRIYQDTHEPILEKYPWRHLALRARSFNNALTQFSGFRVLHTNAWVAIIFCLGAAAWTRGRGGMAAVTLTLIHLLNCLVTVVFMFPNNRYVNATEFLLFAAVAIIIWEVGDKLVPLLRSRRSAPTEVVRAPA